MGCWIYTNCRWKPCPYCVLSQYAREMEERKRSLERRQFTWNRNRQSQVALSKDPKMLSETCLEDFSRDGCEKSRGNVNNGCLLKCVGAGRELLLTCILKSLPGMTELRGTKTNKIKRTWRWLFSLLSSVYTECMLSSGFFRSLMNSKVIPVVRTSQRRCFGKTSPVRHGKNIFTSVKKFNLLWPVI